GVGMRIARRDLDLTIGNVVSAERVTALPVLASVPELRRRRTQARSRWPVLLGAGIAAGVVAATSLLHFPKVFEVAAAMALPALLVLFRVGRQQALIACIVAASFLSAAPVRIGKLDV